MFVYSQKILKFIEHVKSLVKKVLIEEIGLRVHGNRFNNQQQTHTYPISIVIYNTQSLLGFFDSNFLQMGFHENLMFVEKNQLMNVIRHELAHYMLFIKYGGDIQSHGPEFRQYCQSLGWNEDVYSAKMSLQESSLDFEVEKSPIFRKIQKLMALSESPNQNEAEQAMLKSQELLLKYNLDSINFDAANEEKIYLKRVLKQTKENAKLRSIARILETFFVNTVYSKGDKSIYLEISGNSVNVEIAEHVANILNRDLDALWVQTQKEYPHLKGITAKNSFFLGVAKGYCDKVQALRRSNDSGMTQGLMILENQLAKAKEMVYSQLRSSKSQSNFCPFSSNLGFNAGKNMTLNPAINSAKNAGLALQYQGC